MPGAARLQLGLGLGGLDARVSDITLDDQALRGGELGHGNIALHGVGARQRTIAAGESGSRC